MKSAPSLITPQVFWKWILALSFGAAICLVAGIFAGPVPTDGMIALLRFKRALFAFFTGATLAVSGAALQATLKNPIAEPYMLGVSGGAALCGSLGIWLSQTITPIFAILGAFLTIFPILGLYHSSHSAVLIFGLCVNVFASAFISLLKLIMPPEKTQILLFWLSGSIPYVSSKELLFIGTICLLGIAFFIHQKNQMQLLSLGDSKAKLLGIHPSKLRQRILIITSVMVGTLVSFSGMIGFVGLLVPHLLRFVIGNDQRLLIPTSALLGGMILISLDTLSRLLFGFFYTEIPVGTLTAFFGAPFLIFFLTHFSSSKTQVPTTDIDKKSNLTFTVHSTLINQKTIFSCRALEVCIPNQPTFNLDIELQAGSLLLISGENGRGKTTLLKHLCGLLEPHKGIVEINHKSLASYSSMEIAHTIAYASQFEECDLDLPVMTRLQLSLSQRHLINQDQLDIIQKICLELNLMQTLNKKIGQLSGGEQKRIGIASAFLQTEAVIYCIDEPLTSLDLNNQFRIIDAIKDRLKKNKIFLITSHDQKIVTMLSNQNTLISPLTNHYSKAKSQETHYIVHGG